MKPTGGLLALLIAACWAGELCGQVPFFPPPIGVGNFGYSLGIARQSRNLSFSAYLSRSYNFGYYPYYPTYGYPVNQVTVFNYSAPPVVVTPPPIVVAPVQQIIGRDALAFAEPDRERRLALEERFDPEQFDVIRPRPRRPVEERPAPQEAAEPPERRMPGAPASVFRPVGPNERDRAKQVLPEAPPPAAPKPAPPAPVPPVRQGDDALDAMIPQLAQGKAAFTAQEYGRAERLFRQATLTAPDQAQPFFLLAQAQFALAKYQEAVTSIHNGMRLERNWPGARFRVRDLYGPNAADFGNHLQRLRETLARFPNDPGLLFLLGYQLWFDTHQDEARPLFQRARPLAPDKTFIDRFLQAEQADPVAFADKVTK